MNILDQYQIGCVGGGALSTTADQLVKGVTAFGKEQQPLHYLHWSLYLHVIHLVMAVQDITALPYSRKLNVDNEEAVALT